MQDPKREVASVIHKITATASPDEQLETIQKYFTDDVEFLHPLCRVLPNKGSRKQFLGIYQWYRVLSPNLKLDVDHVTYDSEREVLYVEITQVFHIWFNFIIPSAPAHLLVRLSLKKNPTDGLYYISRQEDNYQLPEFVNLLIPPLAPLIIAAQWLSTVMCNLLAVVGYITGQWRPKVKYE